MDLSQFTVIAIFFVLIVGVPRATPWESGPLDRQDGYDLQRGPVFYEAYYPDDQNPTPMEQHRHQQQQQNPINHKTARRYLNPVSVIERTYQALEDSRNGAAFEKRQNREESYQNNYNTVNMPPEILRGVGEESTNSMAVRYSNDQAYEVARQLKRFVEGLEHDQRSNQEVFEDPRTTYGLPVTEKEFYGRIPSIPTEDKRAFDYENIYSDRRLEDYINVILSAVKKEAMEIAEERLRNAASVPEVADENVRISRRQRFVDAENPPYQVQPEMRTPRARFNYLLRSGTFDSDLPEISSEEWNRLTDGRRNSNHDEPSGGHDSFKTDNLETRSPVSQTVYPRMENIFQPRPQVISYIFSPTKTSSEIIKASSLLKPNVATETTSPVASERPDKNNGDDSTGKIVKSNVVEKSDGLGIASIEVSEIPRHKIRHHHGEIPRLHHQRPTPGNSEK